mgnify:CR=1 FL=1
MIIEYLNIITILILIVLVILIIKLKILDIYGCLIASCIGITVLIGIGSNGLILLFIFFLSTHIITRFRYHEKRKTGLAQSKGGTRAWSREEGFCGVRKMQRCVLLQKLEARLRRL